MELGNYWQKVSCGGLGMVILQKKTLISDQTNSDHLKVAANKGVLAATCKWPLLVATNDPILAATFRWLLLVAANNCLKRKIKYKNRKSH
jgi:hypothetical protein